ncbi:MAG: phosphoenolpyruvate--protein phosphotransferase [Halarsenatibacteraceae bacterium]
MEGNQGTAASPGIAIGQALIQKRHEFKFVQKDIEEAEAELEIKRFYQAVARGKEDVRDLRQKVKKEVGSQESEIFTAHLQIMNDPEFHSLVEKIIQAEQVTAEVAVQRVIRNYAAQFAEIEEDYIEARGADIKDIGDRLLRLLQGVELNQGLIEKEVILVAYELTPSEIARLDADRVLGIVLAEGSRTSHTAILARSLEIPTVVGLGPDVISKISQGDDLIVDGDDGLVFISPDEKTYSNYRKRSQELVAREKELEQYKDLKLERKDGRRVYVNANIGGTVDLEPMLARGADGIGLFRTEFLFLDRDSLPDEEEQFQIYKEVVERVGDRPVVIRTVDIGSDKKPEYLDFPEEINPAMGYRGIRISLNNKEFFKTQLRAILRASKFGNVKIMYPMISAIEEIRNSNSLLRQCRLELLEEDIEFGDPEVGIMIEVPSAVAMVRELAAEVDFLSIGTNDLVQYTLAVDRTNEKIKDQFTPYHPAILRMITRVAAAGREFDIPVAMCGEAAGDRLLIPFWLGIGIDQLSMSPVSILPARETIKKWLDRDKTELIQKVLQMSTVAEIQYYLSRRE